MKLSEAPHDWQLQAWIDAVHLSGYEYTLLTTLRDEGPLHRDRLQEAMGEHCIVTPDAPLYVMQQRGQVRRFKRDDRDTYEITPAGLKALDNDTPPPTDTGNTSSNSEPNTPKTERE